MPRASPETVAQVVAHRRIRPQAHSARRLPANRAVDERAEQRAAPLADFEKDALVGVEVPRVALELPSDLGERLVARDEARLVGVPHEVDAPASGLSHRFDEALGRGFEQLRHGGPRRPQTERTARR